MPHRAFRAPRQESIVEIVIILAIIVGLALFDLAAIAFGADSRHLGKDARNW
jgi:hypothetical protein